MSKKNNRSTKARQQKYDIERERKAAEEAKERQLKRAKKQAAASSSASGKLKVKKKTIKLRKNMKIRGIRVEDAESKKAALQLLLDERAQKKMDVDDTPPAGEAVQARPRTKARSRLMKSLKKKKLNKPKPATAASAAALAAGAAAVLNADAMQT